MAGLAEIVYGTLPPFAQNIAVSAYGYMWHRRRFSGIFEAELRGFKAREGFDAAQWRAYQTTQLRRLLKHAFETVPFYRLKYSAAGFSTAAFDAFELEHLNRLPFLEKDELRRYGTTDLLSVRREHGGQFFASSGSTGTPTNILFSHMFHQRWSAAMEARVRHWAGLHRHMRRGTIGGRRILQTADAPPPYYRFNWVEKQTYFSAYHIAPGTVHDYLHGMIKHRVEYMTGYAMSNYLLAAMLHDRSLEGPPLRAVVTSSETLTADMRGMFRKVYGCRTYDSYSGLEACGLISETEAGALAISPDVGIMELLDDQGQEVPPGDCGEIVSTGLLNFDQPLIRYRIGDVARRGHTAPAQGREMPVVEQILGRVEDTVVGPDGRKMVRFHGLFINLPGLRAAQVVQEAPDRLTIRVIAEPEFSSAEEQIMAQRLQSQLGDVQVTVDRVSELERNANGKVPAVISRVDAA